MFKCQINYTEKRKKKINNKSQNLVFDVIPNKSSYSSYLRNDDPSCGKNELFFPKKNIKCVENTVLRFTVDHSD